MKTKKLLIGLMAACCMTACSNNNDETFTSSNNDQPQLSNEFAISNDEAKGLLNFFVNDGATTRSDGKTITVKDYKVRNIEVTTDDNTEIVPLYEYTTVNENGEEGYSIVIGDSRIQKVLVQVEKGSLADTVNIEPLRWYINSIPAIVENDLCHYYDSLKEKATWGTRDSYVETHYCFLPTAWGQWDPYNLQCPVDTIDNYVIHCPAGCMPIAIAQILAYHRVPSSLSWTSILQSPIVTSSSPSTVKTEVSNLIATLGTQSSTNYSFNSGSSSNSSLAPSVIQSYSLYCSSIYAFNIGEVIMSLANSRPVIMIGDTSITDPNTNTPYGHMWVCDGWKRHHYDNNVYYDYLNMNWGWSGNSNGFYYISNPMSFNTSVVNIVQNFKMITDIH